MEKKELANALEAVLFSLGEAVEIDKLAEALEVREDEIKTAFAALKKKYEKDNRGIKLIEIENSVQMCSNPDYYECIQRVTQIKKQAGLSSAALETLSIIAYNQPVTKGTMDFIRGVDCTYSVEAKGRSEAIGRPILYGTTTEFLRCFGLKSLEDLPPLPEKEVLEENDNKPSDIIEEFVKENEDNNGVELSE